LAEPAKVVKFEVNARRGGVVMSLIRRLKLSDEHSYFKEPFLPKQKAAPQTLLMIKQLFLKFAKRQAQDSLDAGTTKPESVLPG